MPKQIFVKGKKIILFTSVMCTYMQSSHGLRYVVSSFVQYYDVYMNRELYFWEAYKKCIRTNQWYHNVFFTIYHQITQTNNESPRNTICYVCTTYIGTFLKLSYSDVYLGFCPRLIRKFCTREYLASSSLIP